MRTSSRSLYRSPPAPKTEREIERAFHEVDEPVAAGAFATDEPVGASTTESAIGIAGVTPATLGPEPVVTDELSQHEPEIEPRREDIPILLAGALLAGLVFLPWYKATGLGTRALTFTGWASGTWGPLIFFLGLGAVVLVVLRRMRIAVKLPFPESIVLEGFGWLATLTAILKARFRPTPPSFQQLQTVSWVYVAVAAGIGLALLAGRVSGKTPFVPVPGWHKGRAGKVGALILVVVLAGGAAFGFMNKIKPAGTSSAPVAGSTNAPQVVKGLPSCAKDFPVPSDFTPFNGIASSNALKTCVATFQTTHATTEAANLLAQAFTRGGWTFTRGTAGSQATTFQITKPKCGSATVIPSANKQVYAVINVSNCTAK